MVEINGHYFDASKIREVVPDYDSYSAVIKYYDGHVLKFSPTLRTECLSDFVRMIVDKISDSKRNNMINE